MIGYSENNDHSYFSVLVTPVWFIFDTKVSLFTLIWEIIVYKLYRYTCTSEEDI